MDAGRGQRASGDSVHASTGQSFYRGRDEYRRPFVTAAFQPPTFNFPNYITALSHFSCRIFFLVINNIGFFVFSHFGASHLPTQPLSLSLSLFIQMTRAFRSVVVVSERERPQPFPRFLMRRCHFRRG